MQPGLWHSTILILLFIKERHSQREMMKKGIFVTATQTGTGKTVTSALIAAALRQNQRDVAYYKPIQTGAVKEGGRWFAPDARFVELATKGECPCYSSYLFPFPASPHLAARLAQKRVRLRKLLEDYQRIADQHERIVVEGAGGLYVPLNGKGELVAHIAESLELNVVLVADAGLGCINSVSLSLHYLRSLGPRKVSVLLFHEGAKPGLIEKDNCKILRKLHGLSQVHLLAKIKGVMTDDLELGAFARGLKNFPGAREIESWFDA
jgi:dethiobiotin synthetase